ncbi:MAG: ribosomal-processing cysteine protease Prp [Lachnospiraceae bacterium]|nr:ribosomal-processing cysteine protease Prp [Lachnospiraceae bacterium]
MTTITYTEHDLVIDGHSGNPIVCTGISAISQMVANFVEERGWADVIVSDGHLEIRNVPDEHCGNALFQAMVIAFEDIAVQYPDCVKIVIE